MNWFSCLFLCLGSGLVSGAFVGWFVLRFFPVFLGWKSDEPFWPRR